MCWYLSEFQVQKVCWWQVHLEPPPRVCWACSYLRPESPDLPFFSSTDVCFKLPVTWPLQVWSVNISWKLRVRSSAGRTVIFISSSRAVRSAEEWNSAGANIDGTSWSHWQPSDQPITCSSSSSSCTDTDTSTTLALRLLSCWFGSSFSQWAEYQQQAPLHHHRPTNIYISLSLWVEVKYVIRNYQLFESSNQSISRICTSIKILVKKKSFYFPLEIKLQQSPGWDLQLTFTVGPISWIFTVGILQLTWWYASIGIFIIILKTRVLSLFHQPCLTVSPLCFTSSPWPTHTHSQRDMRATRAATSVCPLAAVVPLSGAVQYNQK